MDDDFDGVPPNKFAPEPVESEIGATPDREYAPFFFPPEGASLIFTFTEAVFMRIASAMRNGAMMTYGNEGPAVYWEFIKQVDYPVTFCEQLIACLTTDTDVQDALAELIRTNDAIGAALSDYMLAHPGGTKYPRDQQLPSGVSGASFLSGNPDCDPDILFAQCVGTVETAVQLTNDFMNQWQVYNASGTVAAAIIQAIPGVGIVADASGVEGVIEYANALADAIQENFNADNNLEYREQLACAFFCAAKDDCNLSIDDCLTILQGRLSGELTFTNVAELFLSLLDANITGINVADLYLCAFFGLVKLGNWLLPVSWGVDIFAITVSTFDTPNNDWETLCTDCPPEGPRWPLYPIATFAAQVLEYLGQDPDDTSWDLYSVVCITPLGAPFTGSNSVTYYYGYNVSMDPASGPYVTDFSIEDLTNNERAYAFMNNSTFEQGDHFHGTTGLAYWIAQGNRVTAGTCTFRVKPR